MLRERYAWRPLSVREVTPFATAEEAWLWYARCQLARIEGVRFVADAGETARPCDPDDIYRAVDGLLRAGALDRRHVVVLGRFGRRLSPPDPWDGDTPAETALWEEALDRLSSVLKAKGILS